MPTVTADLQRKYRYNATIAINNTDSVHSQVPVDEFTPPPMRTEPVTSMNRKLGQVALAARPSWGEMTLRLALRAGDPNSTAQLIAELQVMRDADMDTCDVTLSLLNGIVVGDNSVNYIQHFANCRLTGYKLDPVSRKGDDDMIHLELTLIPSQVSSRIQGPQIPAV